MNIAKSYEFFKPEKCTEKIHIIGCGAIGSTLAENLVRYGLTNIVLYDFDFVSEHNIANQLYVQSDIGKLKVDALADHLYAINPELKDRLRKQPMGYIDQRLSGYVFLCVDSIDLRRQIAKDNVYNPSIKAMFDYRMALVDGQHYGADWSSDKMKEDFINSMNFTQEEADAQTPMSACNLALSVNSTVRMVVAAGVSNFINFVKTGKIKKIIIVNAFEHLMEAA